MFLNRVILWHDMLCYPMVWYAMGFICYAMRFVRYAMVYVVKDKHSVTYIIFFNGYEFYFFASIYVGHNSLVYKC